MRGRLDLWSVQGYHAHVTARGQQIAGGGTWWLVSLSYSLQQHLKGWNWSEIESKYVFAYSSAGVVSLPCRSISQGRETKSLITMNRRGKKNITFLIKISQKARENQKKMRNSHHWPDAMISTIIMSVRTMWTALSRGMIIVASLSNKNRMRGNCGRTVRRRKPASSGTWWKETINQFRGKSVMKHEPEKFGLKKPGTQNVEWKNFEQKT